MDANVSSVGDLFSGTVQYVIPEFQRSYAWEREKQWEPLWEDVVNLADRVLKSRSNGHSRVAPHFMGALVLQGEPVRNGTLADVPCALGRRSIVVDGQQRLTTLLVLIRALVGVADEMELSEEVEGLRALVCNAELDGNWRYKVMPSSEQDLVACRSLMLNPTGDVSVSYGDQLAGRNRINACYDFLSDACKNFLRRDDESLAAQRLSAVEDSILNHLEVAVLGLADDEQPNMVFKTLNARGEELAQHELVKNTVMLEAGVVTDREEARKCWHAFEDGWRIGKSGEGELIDRFLAAWLASVRRKNIPTSRLSAEFRAFVNGWKMDGCDVRDAFEMLNRGGGIYRDVVTGPTLNAAISTPAFQDLGPLVSCRSASGSWSHPTEFRRTRSARWWRCWRATSSAGPWSSFSRPPPPCSWG